MINRDIVDCLLHGNGEGCMCSAHNWYECGCDDVIWSEMFVREAANEIILLRLLGNQLAVTVENLIGDRPIPEDVEQLLASWKMVSNG